jgi:CheY-like chemotaxis protein
VHGLKVFSHGGSERGAPVDVARVADAALHLLSNEIRQRARVVREFRPAPPVDVSEAHLTQVFLNLILNALQSIPEGAADRNEVRVSVGASPDGEAVIEVRDSGAGMTPDVLARVFDPFFTTRAIGAGKGLGLSICHGIVTAAGGSIEAFSEVRMGSRFRVTLPPAEGAPTPDESRDEANRRGRVLLVEDDPLVARAVRRTLGAEHDVTCVDGGRAALATLQGSEFDVILCDLMMPEMTGLDLHAELSRSRPEAAARMVFLSGGAFTDAAREFFSRIPNPQVDKPFEPAHLREVVRRVARR